MLTPQCPKLVVRNMEEAVGNQKEGAHITLVKPNFVPLKTILISDVPFGTAKKSVTFRTDCKLVNFRYPRWTNFLSFDQIFSRKLPGG